ncbi:MAG: DUF433 domain-containing protein [Actinobacteria bacterium]|nr:DUF433 domain-containing protein [Actinomycetota bacterium]
MNRAKESQLPSRPSAKPLYIVADAARYGHAKPNDVRRWLEGYTVKGQAYPPFLEPPTGRPRGKLALSLENLIEVAFVAGLKRKSIPLPTIRKAHRIAQDEFGEFPFARQPVFVGGREIFMRASEYVAHEAEHLTNLTKGGQRALEPVLHEYLEQITWEGGWPVEWYPRAGVSLNPGISFGQPSVRGIRTEILRSRFLASESVEFIAEDFGLTLQDVEEALRFELALEQAA